ncbi:hypothetical protein [Azotobacter vinelandii]|uniref:hypothetical protein n=1 Tax=Azotobacter vinelandii TaxID=354 RepID=UPI00091102C6|nr:hypothetical protein [Azotobacter vinelandii]WKN20568.1 hypothetical protein AVAEIV_003568 [Azotobacter vinelandii]WKN23153.1 hypothetical protein AVAEIV_001188 [Azotobacter vinelandii]SFY22719.1 hypothetical protein SAMN04244547_04582 [Azotobacter vinelandii]
MSAHRQPDTAKPFGKIIQCAPLLLAALLLAAAMVLLYGSVSFYLWKTSEEVSPAITALWLTLPLSLIGAGAALSLPDLARYALQKNWSWFSTFVATSLALGIMAATLKFTGHWLGRVDLVRELSGNEFEQAMAFGLLTVILASWVVAYVVALVKLVCLALQDVSLRAVVSNYVQAVFHHLKAARRPDDHDN